jgi:hypothetical protein
MAVSEHEFLYRNQHNCVILTPAESKRHALEHPITIVHEPDVVDSSDPLPWANAC